jgi:hypothetical protein
MDRVRGFGQMGFHMYFKSPKVERKNNNTNRAYDYDGREQRAI